MHPASPDRQTAPTSRDAEVGSLRFTLEVAGVVDPSSGRALTEELLVGVAGGLGFAYFVFQYPGFTSLYVDGRVNLLVQKRERVAAPIHRLGLLHDVSETSSSNVAEGLLREELDLRGAALVSVDLPTLLAAAMPIELRGMMPLTVAVTEIEGGVRVHRSVVTRELSWQELAARGPVPARLGTGFTGFARPHRSQCRASDRGGDQFDHRRNAVPPMTNFGRSGLEKWADLVGGRTGRSWSKLFPDDGAMRGAMGWVRFWLAGPATDGAAQRALYADHLAAAAGLLRRPGLTNAADAYRRLAEMWVRCCAGASGIGRGRPRRAPSWLRAGPSCAGGFGALAQLPATGALESGSSRLLDELAAGIRAIREQEGTALDLLEAAMA